MALSTVILAASPIPSAAITFILSDNYYKVAEIVRTTEIPASSKIFSDSDHLLSAITTTTWDRDLCSITMTSELSFTTDWVCDPRRAIDKETQYTNLDDDPALEFRGCVSSRVKGFSTKHDSGALRFWGVEIEDIITPWVELGGPIIGFDYSWYDQPMSLIVGDGCRPKYFGAHKLSVRLGKKRAVVFYWHKSYKEYIEDCLEKGLF